MNEHQILIELVYPYLKSLGYHESSFKIQVRIDGVQNSRFADLVVYDRELPYVAVEIKNDIPDKNDVDLLKFHPYIRKLQSNASALSAPFYLLTNGFSFLWLETDAVGRPSLLLEPVVPTTLRAEQPHQHSKEDIVNTLYSLQDFFRGPFQLNELNVLSALFVMAKLLSEQGDNKLKEELLNISESHDASVRVPFSKLIKTPNLGQAQIAYAFEILEQISFSSLSLHDLLDVLDIVFIGRQRQSHELRIPHWLADLLVRLGQLQDHMHNVLDISCGYGEILTAASLSSKDIPVWGISYSTESTLWSQLQLVALRRKREFVLQGVFSPFEFLRSYRLPFSSHIITAPQWGVKVKEDYPHFHSYLQSAGISNFEDLCLEFAIQHVRPNGRVVMLVSENMLMARGRRQVTRDFIRDNTRLTAIISLNNGALLPYSSIKTSILVLDKIKTKEDHSVFMAQIKGNIVGDTFQSSDNSQISEVLNCFEQWTNYKRIEPSTSAWIVSASMLNYRNLAASHYLPQDTSIYVQSDLFERIVPLKEVTSLIKRGPSITLDSSGSIPVIGPSAIRAMTLNVDRLGLTTTSKISAQFLTVQANDILINNIGDNIGAAAVVDEDLTGYYISRHVILIRPNVSRVLPNYLAVAINSNYVQLQIRQRAIGSVMPTLTLSAISEVNIPVPGFERQHEIVSEVENARRKFIDAKKGLAEAENQFNNLIQKLYSEE